MGDDDFVPKREGLLIKWHYLIVAGLTLLTTSIAPHVIYNWHSSSNSNDVAQKLAEQDNKIQAIQKELDECKVVQNFLLQERADREQAGRDLVAPDYTRRR